MLCWLEVFWLAVNFFNQSLGLHWVQKIPNAITFCCYLAIVAVKYAARVFFKKGYPRPLNHLFFVFPNKQYNFYNRLMLKMSIQYPASGFELTTF